MQSFFGHLCLFAAPAQRSRQRPLIPFFGGFVCKAYGEERTRDLKHPDQSIYTGGFLASEFTW